MNPRYSNYIKSALFFITLFVSLIMAPKVYQASETTKELDGIKTLSNDTVYYYDLNGDGKTEKILCKITVNYDKRKTTLKLYINDALSLSKIEDGLFFLVTILDLDKSDNYLDFFISTTMESGCMDNSFFTRYDGTKFLDYVTFDIKTLTKKFDSSRYYINKLNGDGKFTMVIDTPIYSPAIGCYFCYVPFRLKDNVLSAITTNTYTLTADSSNYKYKAVKSFSVYKKAGSKNVVYKVKKSDKVFFDKMYISKSGKAYFRIINNKGKKGWIKSDQENLFAECPAWG
ncbi:SH3 domain-containing protein [Anaerocolumna sp. MB42-C2]|uniref:SH3 domain-containing protein n=1 Tax=Anaerocolumna sp. MB42-C2 TaxID=3070997 RepID=UPI0027E209E2|nr:SH3 domain-containing protein [Anaerocolumna sp. MB42-C2]WMJ88195.1 SH3 domain-containing protein [Anaerocolumna sp. MB42-C2]